MPTSPEANRPLARPWRGRAEMLVRRYPPLRRMAEPYLDRSRRIARAAVLMERLRRRHGLSGPTSGTPSLPTVTDIAALEHAVLNGNAADAWMSTLLSSGDVPLAAMAMLRRTLAGGQTAHARNLGQLLEQHPGLEHVGDAGLALLALQEDAPADAWRRLRRHDPSIVVPLVPGAYFRAGFLMEPARARTVLDDALADRIDAGSDPSAWLEIAKVAFAGGAEDHSAAASERAVRLATGSGNSQRAARIRAETAWLSQWYGKAGAACAPVTAPATEIPFAVIDYKSPDRWRSSVNLGDPVQTLASLGHLARRSGLRFTGEPDLAELVDELRERVRPDRMVTGDDATVRLYTIQRDASTFCAVPDGTWTIAFGWMMHRILGMRYDIPLNPRLRPIFVSFHVKGPELLTPDVLAYLRSYAPIGCRDWNTVFLLLAADVPAFFSGCLTTTIDTLFPKVPDARPAGTLFVDTAPTGPGDTFAQEYPAVRERSLVTNLREAIERVGGYRDRYRRVVTSRLHCYLPARSIGADVEFRPKNPSDARFDGLAWIADEEYERIRQGILTKLSTVLAAITSGHSEAEVYALWREICAADVADAERRLHSVGEIAPSRIDVAATCARIRRKATVVERREAAVGGDELHVEFSLDGNLKHQLAVVLDSLVRHTSQPIRAHILCRDHGPADRERMTRWFPEVSFVWLPTDQVDYGHIRGMISHITVATMDRLLLPDLLPDVDRIIHFDLDALCLGDLAELWAIDLQGTPLAGRVSPHPAYLSGFAGFVKSAARLKGDRELARELILRTHSRHRFDFTLINAGIMVLDLDRMRRDGFSRHFLPYAERFGLNDQAVLNAYAGAARVELDPVWNWHPRLEDLADPKIAHWAGPLKPWGPQWVAARELWQAAEQSLAERVAAHRESSKAVA